MWLDLIVFDIKFDIVEGIYSILQNKSQAKKNSICGKLKRAIILVMNPQKS